MMEHTDFMFWIFFYCFVAGFYQVVGEFVLIQESAYYDVSEPKCQALGLEAAKMETEKAYRQAVEVIVATHNGVIPIWIGLHYSDTDNTFRWTDGTKSFRDNWYKGGSYNEPDNLSTEQCIAVHKTWDTYASMVTRDCDAKKYYILCGSYDPPPIESDVFHDVTTSSVASGLQLSSVNVKSNIACVRHCVSTESCTHYSISSDRSRCVLFSGRTSPGQTSIGSLYSRLE